MPGVREVVAGRYELLEVLGRGGMGVVFRARDRVLERVVAVKVLPAERAEDETFVARFEREARAAAGLNHPNIAAVFDTGCDEGTRFIVMELVPGSSLAELLRRTAPLRPARAATIAGQIAIALDVAHSAGIIHRDIKPANTMVDGRGAVKVLDFGIARAVGDTSLTQTAMVLGSAPYLAPEVARGERADERSDIYSLGCVLYEMLTGGPPFTGELTAAILHQHTDGRPRPPRELNPTVPQALEALVLRMLAKSPGTRPQGARQVAHALLNPPQGPEAASWSREGQTASRPAPTRPLSRHRRFDGRRTLTLAIVAGLVCLGVLLLLLGSSSSQHRVGTTRGAYTRPVHTSVARTGSTPSSQSNHSPPQSAQPTVPAAAAQLTRLAAQDLAAGTIDQQASQQLLAHLQEILNTSGNGDSNNAPHKLDDFSKQVAQLGQHGDIQPAALPAITKAIDDLRSAVARAGPAHTNPAAGNPAPAPAKHPKPPNH